MFWNSRGIALRHSREAAPFPPPLRGSGPDIFLISRLIWILKKHGWYNSQLGQQWICPGGEPYSSPPRHPSSKDQTARDHVSQEGQTMRRESGNILKINKNCFIRQTLPRLMNTQLHQKLRAHTWDRYRTFHHLLIRLCGTMQPCTCWWKENAPFWY